MRDYRVVLNAAEPGVALLAPAILASNIEADNVATLNEKLDDAEAVDDAAEALSLVLEELVARGIMGADGIPDRPASMAVEPDKNIRRYIAGRTQRVAVLRPWIDSVDTVLRSHNVAVLRPEVPLDYPPAGSTARPR